MSSDGENDYDVALKILHTADWHLGRKFPSFDEHDQLTLSHARMEVVDRIFGVAKMHDVDAVLCAGDLFDEPNPEREFYSELATRLCQMPWSKPVILLPGNHDPLIAGSVYHADHEFRRLLPEFVRVVDRSDFEMPLGEAGVLYARPCTSKAGQDDNALLLPAREDGDERIRIGMVHGSTWTKDDFQTNFPIAEDAARKRGMDYLAVGDTHAFEIVPEGARECPIVYPSAPEATNFGEENTGFVVVAFFMRTRRRPRLHREPVARWRWREEEVTTLDDLQRLRTEDLSRTVLRLTLDLRVAASLYEEVERILDELKGTRAAHGRVGILQLDKEGLLLDTTDIESFFDELPDVLKEAARRLKEAESGDQPAAAQRALYHLYRLSRKYAGGTT